MDKYDDASTDENVLIFNVPDEALERAAGTQGQAWTLNYSTYNYYQCTYRQPHLAQRTCCCVAPSEIHQAEDGLGVGVPLLSGLSIPIQFLPIILMRHAEVDMRAGVGSLGNLTKPICRVG